MYLAFLKRDRSQGKLPITGRPNRERLITSLALCRLFPEPGVPEYSLIISLHHFEPTEDSRVNVISRDSSNPGSCNTHYSFHWDKPIDIAQIRNSSKMINPAAKRGEGKDPHQTIRKARPHRTCNIQKNTPLPLDKFTCCDRKSYNVDSNNHIANSSSYSIPSR